MRRVLLGFVLIAIVSVPAVSIGQWLRYPTADVPRKADGTPNLTAAAPRLPDGKPDFSAIWHVAKRATRATRPRAVHPAATRDRRVTARARSRQWICPAACRISRGRRRSSSSARPTTAATIPHVRCLPDNPPRHWGLPHLNKTSTRQSCWRCSTKSTPCTGRSSHRWPAAARRSHARMEGLLDRTMGERHARRPDHGFRDGLWIDLHGSPMSDAAKMTERIRRPNYGTLEMEITVDDPKVYTQAVDRPDGAGHRARHGADGRILPGE